MDLQKIIDQINENSRLSAGSQYNLGRFIDDLRKIKNKNLPVFFEDNEFGQYYLRPTNFISWRGSYNCLALLASNDDNNLTSIDHLLSLAENANGNIFEGYKGGDFKMDKSTPIYCTTDCSRSSHSKKINYGTSINSQWIISGIYQEDDKILIKTSVCNVYGDLENIMENIKKYT